MILLPPARLHRTILEVYFWTNIRKGDHPINVQDVMFSYTFLSLFVIPESLKQISCYSVICSVFCGTDNNVNLPSSSLLEELIEIMFLYQPHHHHTSTNQIESETG